ncbi:MAG: secondary thiamine-phosphate synthase enzyme YjbQ [Actinomycetota bacterium]|nr:secondary thiamine-phosphate synthase enzyme YjbQ [Actinomycetota bacterium]
MSNAKRTPLVFATSADLEVATSSPLELIDLTDHCTELVAAAGATTGHLHLFCRHTTCGLLVNEDERGFHEDLERLLDRLAPASDYWAHDDLTRRWQNLEDETRANGHSHVRASLVSNPCLVVPVVGGSLALGTWQRIFMLELDGPRARVVNASVWGASAGHTGGITPGDSGM